MENGDKLLALYACCIPVNGHRRSVICDIQRGTYYPVPNALFELVTTYSDYTLEEIYKMFADDTDTIREYISYVKDNDLGHVISRAEKDAFPTINLDWIRPELISNAILDIDANTLPLPFDKISNELDEMGCKGLQIRFFSDFSVAEISNVVKCFDRTRIRHIDLLFKYNKDNSRAAIQTLFYTQERISFITVYDSPENDVVDGDNEKGAIFFEPGAISSHLHCGVITREAFSVNMDAFLESRHYNSCLNRKISIDKGGNIKNCPSMIQSFGNIKDTSLLEVINHPDFKKYWGITKDHISVCKDCEFRHICTDCRAYLEDPADDYSKPLKCGYNPYTCTWEEWSVNPLKQAAIDIYEMRNVLPDFKLNHDYVPC